MIYEPKNLSEKSENGRCFYRCISALTFGSMLSSNSCSVESSGKNASSSGRSFPAGWVNFFHRLGPYRSSLVPTHAPGVSPLGRLRSASWLLPASERGEVSLRIRLLLLPTHAAACPVPELQPNRVLQSMVVRPFRCGKQGGTYDHRWQGDRDSLSLHAGDHQAARRLSRLTSSLFYPEGTSSE